ncbi:MAG TPA: PadR family transcriptional regulator [Nitrososphaerales archaeon]|nr:PadR family transcriptional regulator [Nitrososphaerales archaeon]
MDWSKKAHRGLRTWILVILQQGPKNGAEIMDAMESGSRGWWRPSPGSVYPMLEQLSGEGLVKKRDSDGRYEVTPQGREESEWPSRVLSSGPLSIERILGDMSSNVSYLEDLARSKDPKVTENSRQIRELADRLSKIGAPS